jgi:hypothetical protein
MTALTGKARSFEWTTECEEAFGELKKRLIEFPILAFPSPDPSHKFILDTDASDHGIGAVLSQVQDGQERVLAYASKTLNKGQRNYCTTYRELLAVVEFVLHFKHYLLGRTFTVRTDHSSLRWLHRFRDAEGLVGRWIARMANYQYTIEHRAGVSHGNADALSRRPVPQRRRRCGREKCPECPTGEGTPVKCVLRIAAYDTEYKMQVVAWPLADSAPAAKRGGTSAMVATVREKGNGECGTGTDRGVSDVGESCSGSEHDVADGEEEWVTGSNWLESWTSKELLDLQQGDSTIGVVREWVKGSCKPSRRALQGHSKEVRQLCRLWLTLVVEKELLYRRWVDKDGNTVLQLLAPLALRETIFHHLHSSRTSGHLGLKRTLFKVRSRYFWPQVKRDIMSWCQECEQCAQTRPGPHHRAKLHQVPVGAKFDRIAIDVMGELPETRNGNKYILVVGDYFTKWTQAFALPNQTAQSVADVLATQFFSVFGIPRWIHSDQGRNFESFLFQELCKLLEVKKTRTTPYRPQSDGMIERFNRTCGQMLKAFVGENRDDWDDHLPYLTQAYRSSPHESTGLTPNMMVFGEELSLPIDVMVGAPPRHERHYVCEIEYVEWLRKTLQHAHETARKHLGIAATRQKSYYDRSSNPRCYAKGQYVWWWYPPAANKKLGKGWKGPFRIMARPTDVHCVLQLDPDSREKRVHIDQVKPHLGRCPAVWRKWEEELTDEEVCHSSGEEDKEVGEEIATSCKEDRRVETDVSVGSMPSETGSGVDESEEEDIKLSTNLIYC